MPASEDQAKPLIIYEATNIRPHEPGNFRAWGRLARIGFFDFVKHESRDQQVDLALASFYGVRMDYDLVLARPDRQEKLINEDEDHSTFMPFHSLTGLGMKIDEFEPLNWRRALEK